jgi:hypothetical protein
VEPTADPAALDAAARALRQLAQNLGASSLTGTFARQSSASRWSGRAATQFQNAVKDDAGKASGLAGELNAIAGLIEDGARKVRQIRADQAKQAAAAAAKGVPVKPLAAYPR